MSEGVRMKKDNKGFSMVEMIIVIAIVGILAGTVVVLSGHIKYGNTKKVAAAIDTSISKLQAYAMSKSGKQYMYIYQSGGDYYTAKLTDNLTSFDASKLNDTNGTKIANGSVEIFVNSESGDKISGHSFIKLAYDKSGIFDANATKAVIESGGASGESEINTIVVKGGSTFTIKLIKSTGKHIFSE